ncbi:MAG: hypothetical protein DMF68_14580 [Acidobacteria bacterium]|nr:MAG: hypothetical protein DMF68_14580 [Acidobacteriota bacterium]
MSHTKIALDSLPAQFTEQVDAFICSASFEKRSTVIPSSLNRENIDRTIIFANKVGYTSLIDETAEQLKAMFGERATIASVAMENPLTVADRLQHELLHLKPRSTNTFAIDITSFTHESLLIVLRVLREYVRPPDKVFCLYNGATDYSTGLPPDQKWLTKGVGEIRSVLGYPGRIIPTQKIHLIVLVGFETERAERIIAAYEPSELSLGYGSPLESISLPLHNLNKKFHKKLSDRYKNVSDFTFSCEDAIAAKIAVQKRVESRNGFNVFIAPMNTKVSTVGVALAALENPAIQLCYATAEQYNFEAYSTPSDQCYLFEAPLLAPVGV